MGFVLAHCRRIDSSTIKSKSSKRSKTVYPADMVAHLWAHKSKEYARSSGRGNIYFDGDTIYSYGSHFPIARHVTRKGKSAVLLTSRTSSHTTNGHKWIVEGACRHLTVFHVADVTGQEPRKQFEEYRNRFQELARKYIKSRQNKPYVLDQLEGLVEEANAFSTFFGLRIRLTLPAESDMAAECKAIETKQREAKKREEARRKQEATERVQKWLTGETDYCPYGQEIRLRIKGDELQTSHGARVPLKHAAVAFRIIKQLRDKGQTYERRNGRTIRLGYFALNAIDTRGNVTAGCHNVAWEEIARVATLAGVN